MYVFMIFSHSISVEVKNMNNKSSMKMYVPGAKQAIDKMKYEIANEFGVNLGPDATSRANGRVGGEITKRLVQNGMNQLGSGYNTK
jgi:small acid-soluble spore protein A (major alpha-type SASP)